MNTAKEPGRWPVGSFSRLNKERSARCHRLKVGLKCKRADKMRVKEFLRSRGR